MNDVNDMNDTNEYTPIIDVVSITDDLLERHNEFLALASDDVTDKALHDYILHTEKTAARFLRVMMCFSNIGIIDKPVEFAHPGVFKKYTLGKSGLPSVIDVTIDKSTILMSFTGELESIRTSSVSFSDVCEDDFNWNEFSIDVLELIHVRVYNRKRLSEAKVDIALSDVSDHDGSNIELTL
jgi:hypothetical protein